MRRGIVLLIVLVLLIFIGSRVLFRGKAPPTLRERMAEAEEPERRAGRRRGRLETKEKVTREEKRLQRERRREERRRLREERKRRRLEERMRREAERARRGRRRRAVGLNVLQAIFYSETGSYVIIDGKTLRVGDEISGRRIASIEKDKITVLYRGEIKTVRVGESVFPKPLLAPRR